MSHEYRSTMPMASGERARRQAELMDKMNSLGAQLEALRQRYKELERRLADFQREADPNVIHNPNLDGELRYIKPEHVSQYSIARANGWKASDEIRRLRDELTFLNEKYSGL